MFQMNTRTGTRIATTLMVLGLTLAVASSAFAVENRGEVNASVEMTQYCVNLDLGTDLNFGAAGIGEAIEEIDDHAITIRNSGTGAARIMVQGTDATGPDGHSWTLADTSAPGVFSWYFVDLSENSDGNPVFVSKEPRVLVERLEYQQTIALNATMMTPTCTTAPGIYTFGATIFATAADLP